MPGSSKQCAIASARNATTDATPAVVILNELDMEAARTRQEKRTGAWRGLRASEWSASREAECSSVHDRAQDSSALVAARADADDVAKRKETVAARQRPLRHRA